MFENNPFPISKGNSRLRSFKNQVGGHSCFLKEHQTSEFVFKPYNKVEADFYELVFSSTELKLKDVVPKYYGLNYCPSEKIESIDLEDSQEPTQVDSPVLNSRRRSLSEKDPERFWLREGDDLTPRKFRSHSEWFTLLFKKRFNKDNTGSLILSVLLLSSVPEAGRPHSQILKAMCPRS